MKTKYHPNYSRAYFSSESQRNLRPRHIFVVVTKRIVLCIERIFKMSNIFRSLLIHFALFDHPGILDASLLRFPLLLLALLLLFSSPRPSLAASREEMKKLVARGVRHTLGSLVSIDH